MYIYMSNKISIKKYNKKSKKNKKIKIMYGGLKCDNPHNKAYMMLGHGVTEMGIFDVPDNCVYITTTICGTSSQHDFYKVNEVIQLFFNNKELVKNPCNINNFNELNRIVSKKSKVDNYIGNTNSNATTNENVNYLNMHISRETCDISATCAKNYLFKYKNSSYEPCLYWFYKDDEVLNEHPIKEKHDMIRFSYSGLMSADNSFQTDIMITCRNPKYSFWKYPMLTTKEITRIYEYSLYPTTEEIFKKIEDLNIDITSYLKITDTNDEKYFNPLNPPSDINDGEWHEHYDDYKYIISGYDFVKLIRDNFTILQTELFKMFPGVHYNTACRGFSKPTDLYILDELIYPKAMQRQISVNNKENLLDVYREEEGEGERKEQELLQRTNPEYSSVGEPPIYNFPQFKPLYKIGKWFGRGKKNKKTRRNKKYKNKTRRNKRCKNKK